MPIPALRAATIFPFAALLLLGACGEPPTESSLPLSAKVSGGASGYTMMDIGGTSSSAAAVNPSGQIVGSARLAGKFRTVFWDKKGVMNDLGDLGLVPRPPSMVPSPPGPAGATGINPAGQVVGNIHYPGTDRAFLWDKGVMTDLGSLGDAFRYFSFAYGINPAGQVVGESNTMDMGFQAFLWENGVMTMLPPLPPVSGVRRSAALAISPSGVVVGSSGVKAVLWQNGVVTDLGIPGDAVATGINAAGQIVGASSLTGR